MDSRAAAQLAEAVCGVGAEGFDVEADGEALLGAGEVDEGGTDDAVEDGVGVVEALRRGG